MADATNTAAEPSFREQVEQAEKQEQTQAQPAEQLQEAEQAQPAEVKTEVKEEKVVPLQALHEARALLKAERQAAQQARAQAEAYQRQQLEMMQYLQSLQQPKQELPAFDQDPLRNIHGNLTQTQEQVQALARQLAQGQQNAYQQEQVALAEYQFRTAAAQADQEFQARQPDAAEGINYLKSQRSKMYEAMGMTKSEATARMLKDERDLVAYCFQNGENPAERAYQMAKEVGYMPAAQKMNMQKAGQAAALPTNGSGQGGGRLSLDALAKLKGKDFLDATAEGKWKQIMRDR